MTAGPSHPPCHLGRNGNPTRPELAAAAHLPAEMPAGPVWGGQRECQATGQPPTHLCAYSSGHVPGLGAALTCHATPLRSENPEKAACSDNEASSPRRPPRGGHTHALTRAPREAAARRRAWGSAVCGGRSWSTEGAGLPWGPWPSPHHGRRPIPPESCHHRSHQGWEPGGCCGRTSVPQISEPSVSDPSPQLSCKDDGHGLVTLPYDACPQWWRWTAHPAPWRSGVSLCPMRALLPFQPLCTLSCTRGAHGTAPVPA